MEPKPLDEMLESLREELEERAAERDIAHMRHIVRIAVALKPILRYLSDQGITAFTTDWSELHVNEKMLRAADQAPTVLERGIRDGEYDRWSCTIDGVRCVALTDAAFSVKSKEDSDEQSDEPTST